MRKDIILLMLLIMIASLNLGCVSDRNDSIIKEGIDNRSHAYSAVASTTAGNLTIVSSFPIVCLNHSADKDESKFTGFAPNTWYGMENNVRGSRIYNLMAVIDKPSVVGELPDFSSLHDIKVTLPDGRVSCASDFEAWKTVDGQTLLNAKSDNIAVVTLSKTNDSAAASYVMNGSSVPINNYSYSEKTVIALTVLI